MTVTLPASIGPYEVLGLLGHGGMGAVYLARDPRFGREVAVKVLHGQFLLDPGVVERFRAEAVIQAKMNHPNVVTVHDFIAEPGLLAIVMERVQGRSLERVISDAAAPLSPRRCVTLMSQVLSALAYAHRRGLVHRDLKPANIVVQDLDGEEIAKVMDFGIAKILGTEKLKTATGATMGTLSYMSPEQVKSPKNVDARSDVYSLGATLYEMATGQLPFEADSEFEVQRKIVYEAPRRPRELSPGLPGSLEAVIERAMAKGPSERFQSCEEFREALGDSSTAPLEANSRRRSPPPLRSPQAETGIPGQPPPVAVGGSYVDAVRLPPAPAIRGTTKWVIIGGAVAIGVLASIIGARSKSIREREETIARDTWIDPTTGLMWARRDSGANTTFSQARAFCQNLTAGGFSDWRVPGIDELESLCNKATPEGESCMRSPLSLSGFWAWGSETKNAFPIFNFAQSRRYGDNRGSDMSDNGRALCVRRPSAK